MRPLAYLLEEWSPWQSFRKNKGSLYIHDLVHDKPDNGEFLKDIFIFPDCVHILIELCTGRTELLYLTHHFG